MYIHQLKLNNLHLMQPVPSNATTDLIFVYGTLKQSFDNEFAKELFADSIFLGEGYFSGELYLCDWFPAALYLPESPSSVHGEIYKMMNASKTLKLLDEYEEITDNPETSLYTRKIIDIRHSNTSVVSCYAYIYNQPVTGLKRIYEGIFIK